MGPPKKRKDLEYEIRSGWMYGTELMVREGELSMVDFGWASLHGDFTCRGRLSATIPDHFNKTVPYRKDRAIFHSSELVENGDTGARPPAAGPRAASHRFVEHNTP